MKKRILIFMMTIFCFVFMRMSVSADSDRSQANPYQVSNKSELVTALKENQSDITIDLTDDIHYGSSDSFRINSNVTINGQRHAMLYDGTNYISSTAGYRLDRNGYQVQFNDLTFGSPDYKANQTYYGILLGYNYQTNLTLNNIQYYGKNGAQPLCSYNPKTVVTMMGHNVFSSIAGSYGQEFMEGAQLISAENSVTDIKHDTDGMYGFFWNSASTDSFTWQIQKNAKVNIDTNKEYLSYAKRINIFMAEGSQLNFNNSDHGVTMSNGSYNSNIVMMKNANLMLSGNGKFGDQNRLAKLNISAMQVASIGFENKQRTGIFNRDVAVNSIRTGTYSYDYWQQRKQLTKSAGTGSMTWNDNLFPINTGKMVYHQNIVASFDAKGYVENNPVVSQLQLSNIQSSGNFNNVDYKIYDHALVSDVTKDQATIETDQSAKYQRMINKHDLTIDKVPAGVYTIYIKVNQDDGQSSQWVAKTVTVDKSLLNVTVPIEMTFNILDNAEFSSTDQYQVINHSNYQTSFRIKTVQTKTDSVNLVNQITNATPSRSLYLALKSISGQVLSLLDTTNRWTQDAFDGSNDFHLIGQYQRPISYRKEEKLRYTMSLAFQ